MKRSTDRILTTHVGSIVRPQALRELSAAASSSRDAAGRERYETGLKALVADVVAAQAAAGLDIVNDGEFGKSSWSNYVLARLTGFEPRPDRLAPADMARPRSRSIRGVHGQRVSARGAGGAR